MKKAFSSLREAYKGMLESEKASKKPHKNEKRFILNLFFSLNNQIFKQFAF